MELARTLYENDTHVIAVENGLLLITAFGSQFATAVGLK